MKHLSFCLLGAANYIDKATLMLKEIGHHVSAAISTDGLPRYLKSADCYDVLDEIPSIVSINYIIVFDPCLDLKVLDNVNKPMILALADSQPFIQYRITTALINEQHEFILSWGQYSKAEIKIYDHCETLISTIDQLDAESLYSKTIDAAVSILEDLVIDLSREIAEIKSSTHVVDIKNLPVNLEFDFSEAASVLEKRSKATQYGQYVCHMGLPYIQLNNNRLVVGGLSCLETSSSQSPGTILSIDVDSIVISTKTRDVGISKLLPLNALPIDYNALIIAHHESQIQTSSDLMRYCFPEKQSMPILSILDRLENSKKHFPEHYAIKTDSKTLTYRALWAQVDNYAAHLTQLGISVGDSVVSFLPKGESAIVVMLAIFKLGAIYVYLDPDLPGERHDLILNDVNPVLLLSNRVMIPKLNCLAAKKTKYWMIEDAESQQYTLPNLKPVSKNDTAYIIYTSGSTGAPKGVSISYASLAWLFNSAECMFDFNEQDVWAQLHSLSFDFSVWEILGALTTGACLYLPSNKVLTQESVISDLLNEKGITVLNQTPSAFSLLLNHVDKIDSSAIGLRYIIFGGENIRESDIRRWFKKFGDRHPALINMYGITEVTVHATFNHLKDDETIQSCIGKPLPGKYIYLLNEAFRPVSVGEKAEIFVGGEGLFTAYLNRAGLTSKRRLAPYFLSDNSKEEVYRTGDYAVQDVSGNFIYKGRLDRQVKILGHRIELEEIAVAVRQFEGIKDATALEHRVNEGDSSLVVFYTCNNKVDEAVLLSWLFDRLPNYMFPNRLLAIKYFPIDKNGKLDAPYLLNKLESKVNRASNCQQTVLSSLQEIWCNLLGALAYDEAEFFSEGGSSLLAMQLISRISARLNVQMTMREVMTHTRFADLYRLINEKMANENALTGFKTSLHPVNYALSAQQRAVYFLNGYIKGGNYSYNVTVQLDFTGYMDINALRKAIDYLLNRHAILKTGFFKEAQQILQKKVAGSTVELKVEFFDFESKAYDNRVIDFGRIAFSLDKAPLIEFLLLTNKAGRHSLLMKLHHIIHDGWSINILRNELAHAYNAYCEGGDPSLPEIESEYSDFVAYQASLLSDKRYSSAEGAYWESAIQHKIYEPLPLDFERPNYPTVEGDRKRVFLDASISASLKKYAMKNRVSLPVLFLAAISIVLRKYSSSDYATIGMPVANRSKPEFENIVGLFANVIPMQVKVDASSSLKSVIEEAKQVCLSGLDHASLPFSDIVSSLGLSRNAYSNPLFQMMFVYHNAHQWRQQTAFKGLKCQPSFANNKASKFDLTMDVLEYDETFLLIFEYSTALFRKSAIDNFSEHMDHVLSELLLDDQQAVGSLSLLSSYDITLYRQLFSYYKPRKLNGDIFDKFKEAVDRHPNAAALRHGGKALSYAELLNEVMKKASALEQALLAGATSSSSMRVALLFSPSPEMIISMLALLKLGVAYIPLDPRFPDERIKYIVTDAKVDCMLVEDGFSDRSNLICKKVIPFSILSSNLASANISRAASLTDVAYIIFTSGTTGQPKGVPIRQDQLLALLESTAEHIKVSAHDATVLAHNAAFDVSVWEIFFTLTHGASLTILPNEFISDVSRFFDVLLENNITYLSQTPSSFSRLAKYATSLPKTSLRKNRLHTFVFAGEPIQYNAISIWSSLFGDPAVNYYNLYGITEGTIHCMFKKVTAETINEKRNNIGRPLSNNCVVLVDEFNQPVSKNVVGEICLSGDGVLDGYINDDGLNDQKFFTASFFGYPPMRWFKTGDYAKLVNSGEFEYVSRKDNQVKIYGYRVSLSEIELQLSRLPFIRRSAVFFEKEGDVPALYLFVALSQEISVVDIRQHLEGELPYYMQPKDIFIIDYFPLTQNGKVDFKSLNKIRHDRAAHHEVVEVRSRSKIQALLVEIWEVQLRKKIERLDGNFFDIGAHSLLLLSVIDEIKNKIGFDIDVIDLFKYPSIKLLANYISANVVSTSTSTKKNRYDSMKKKREMLKKKKAVSKGVVDGK